MSDERTSSSSTSSGVRLPHRVFIYGTLKRNQPNHHFFESSEIGNCQLIGTGRTVHSFPLIVATHWNLPFLLYAHGKGQKIFGEVYDVDDRLLSWMDAFEGHPEVYERERVSVQYMDVEQFDGPSDGTAETAAEDGRTECWTYFLKTFPAGLLHKETMAVYDAHVKPYRADKDLSGPSSIQDALQAECAAVDERQRD